MNLEKQLNEAFNVQTTQYLSELLWFDEEEITSAASRGLDPPDHFNPPSEVPGEEDSLPDEDVFEESEISIKALFAIKSEIGQLLGHIYLTAYIYDTVSPARGKTDSLSLANLTPVELENFGISPGRLLEKATSYQTPPTELTPQIEALINSCDYELNDSSLAV